MRQVGRRQLQLIVMNVHMRRNMQATGMSMQKRHQTLQERQNQKQEVILSILSHDRILISNSKSGNFLALGKTGRGELGCC